VHHRIRADYVATTKCANRALLEPVLNRVLQGCPNGVGHSAKMFLVDWFYGALSYLGAWHGKGTGVPPGNAVPAWRRVRSDCARFPLMAAVISSVIAGDASGQVALTAHGWPRHISIQSGGRH
jgi:hypothetical protein